MFQYFFKIADCTWKKKCFCIYSRKQFVLLFSLSLSEMFSLTILCPIIIIPFPCSILSLDLITLTAPWTWFFFEPGIVRGIDTFKGLLYVITPVPQSTLEKVDLFLQGFIQIPTCLLQVTVHPPVGYIFGKEKTCLFW